MKAFGSTDRGAVRSENQDSFRFELQPGGEVLTAVLCDGMGGAQAGSVASAMGADTFMSHAANSVDISSNASDMRAILTEAVNYANVKVYDKSFADFSCMGMGTTLVAVLISGKRAMVANVGDSRAYFVTKSKISQITHDHSLVAELVARGELTEEEARTHPRKNVITRAIGVEASVRCDIFEPKLNPGDRLLLCSDGLTNMLSDEEILSASNKNEDVEGWCSALIALALERGATDNVTVFAVQR